jgi:cytochrome c oxidase cbb3-type subunit 3/ubiquinol-cytochrome c reductase cytochrome c subunit
MKVSARAPAVSLVAGLTTALLALAACNKPEGPAAREASAPSASSAATAASRRDASAGRAPSFTAPAADPAAMAERGKQLYTRYCDFCHGDEGKGYKADEAPALAGPDFLATASDAFIEQAILRGRPGTTMSAWSLVHGGPLGDAQAADLVAYIRTWQRTPGGGARDAAAAPPASAAPPAGANEAGANEAGASEAGARDAGPGAPAGVAVRGAPVYTARCASCHGTKGLDGKYNELANPELLASASDAFLTTTIARGRAGTPMPAFHGKLTPAQIADVVALLRSWQRPPEELPELPPRPGALQHVVLNPHGPRPAFDPKADFIGVDIVKRELDRHASMILVDARPPGDYARMHVAGAISVPFYEVDKYAAQIPKDRYVITYCSCPHGSSVKGREAFRKLGYPHVAVLDEGILRWRDRGYGVRGGGKP